MRKGAEGVRQGPSMTSLLLDPKRGESISVAPIGPGQERPAPEWGGHDGSHRSDAFRAALCVRRVHRAPRPRTLDRRGENEQGSDQSRKSRQKGESCREPPVATAHREDRENAE